VEKNGRSRSEWYGAEDWRTDKTSELRDKAGHDGEMVSVENGSQSSIAMSKILTKRRS